MAAQKRVTLFGMSGLGKTRLAQMLRDAGDWYHYSVDYRIGTRYLGDAITDNAKRAAMQVPVLRDLLMSDSIYIGSNISFANLAPLASYLGKPGDPAKGGLTFDEYKRRQAQHRAAEIAALLDTGHFIDRAGDLYGYPHFLCDTGGSICEVVDPADPADPVLHHLESRSLLVWIEGSDAHTDALIERFSAAPKPMYYHPDALDLYLEQARHNAGGEANLDPDEFIRATFAKALRHRQPLYRAMARRGITVSAEDVAQVQTAEDFELLIATALDKD